MSGKARGWIRVVLCTAAAAVLGAPTPGDVGGCASPPSPGEDPEIFCRARVFHECLFEVQCGRLASSADCMGIATGCSICNGVVAWASTCLYVTERMALNCFDAMDARVCGADAGDPGECRFCPTTRLPSLCGAPPATACKDVLSDPANCGACGTACAGATPNCVGGTCAP